MYHIICIIIFNVALITFETLINVLYSIISEKRNSSLDMAETMIIRITINLNFIFGNY